MEKAKHIDEMQNNRLTKSFCLEVSASMKQHHNESVIGIRKSKSGRDVPLTSRRMNIIILIEGCSI